LARIAADHLGPEQKVEAKILAARYSDSIGAYAEAFEAAEAALEDANDDPEALFLCGRSKDRLSKYREAIDYLERSVERAGATARKDIESEALCSLALTRWQQGESEGVEKQLETALGLYRRSNDARGECTALATMGIIARSRDNFELAIDYYERVLDLSRRIGDRRIESLALTNLGVFHLDLMDLEAAKEFYEGSLAIKRRIRDRRGEEVTLGGLGEIYMRLGYYETGVRFIKQARSIAEEIKDSWNLCALQATLGTLYVKTGDFVRALDVADHTLSLSREIGSPRYEAFAHDVRGRAMLDLTRFDDAKLEFETAIAIRDDLKESNLKMESTAGLALAFFRSGNADEAAGLAREIAEYVVGGDINGTADPFFIYGAGIEILRATGAQGADELAGHAKELRTGIAEKLKDRPTRDRFLKTTTIDYEPHT
jgi:tetratricopeptide (TPR) repeat protein